MTFYSPVCSRCKDPLPTCHITVVQPSGARIEHHYCQVCAALVLEGKAKQMFQASLEEGAAFEKWWAEEFALTPTWSRKLLARAAFMMGTKYGKGKHE